MKLRSVISVMLVLASLAVCGCTKEKKNEVPYRSEHFSFTDDMSMYMVSYTYLSLKEELVAAGVDFEKPLSEQEKSDGVTWEDYIYDKTVESIENVLLYCEAAKKNDFQISEGLSYKASETITYIKNTASEAGYTPEEYVSEIYGEGVTLDALDISAQMMALSESYELQLKNEVEVTSDEASAYADENPNKFLKFDALRYTTADKELADKLNAAKGQMEFLKIMSGVSGYSLTDSDKNGRPDVLEVKDAVVDTDPAGEFAAESGRGIGDTTVTEEDGKYTVTMLTSVPLRQFDLLFNYRMLYMSSETSDDPMTDLSSLLNQWKEKQGGEEGFANLCARYSDDPTAYYGGIQSGVSMFDIPADIYTWICDDARAEGDTTVIKEENGAFMLYFIDGNIPRWAFEAMEEIKAEKAEEKIDSVKEEIEKEYVFDEKLMREIVSDTLSEITE